MKRQIRIAWTVWSFSLIGVSATHAQLSFGASVGVASGSVSGALANVYARAQLSRDVHITLGNQWMAGPWGCAQMWPESYRCGFDGSTMYVAPELTVGHLAGVTANVEVMVGLFSEFNGLPNHESTLAWGGGVGGDAKLSRRLKAEIKLRHWRLKDELFEELFGQALYVTSAQLGLSIVVF